ncbi:MAG: metallophosphoesterase [Gammaproteobacteria bacterium]|jgi:3',5'-cyclic AMP phosphodiesterase CpdA
MTKQFSRRDFLRYLGSGAVTGTAAILTGCSWTTGGTGSPPLRIVFYTDVHARREWDTPAALTMAADAINRQKADIVIGGGDFITDGFQSSAAAVADRWDVYMDMHRALEGQVHAVIGNHDLVGAIPEDGSAPAEDPRSEFRRRIGVSRTFYSFDAGGYHFMLLDSMDIIGGSLKYRGYVSAEQLEWIRADLATVPGSRPIVLALHMPLVTGFYQMTEGAAEPAPANRVVVNNREVLGLFESHNLLLVLQGHLHVSELIRWGGTTFVTGGAVSGKWWRGSWHGTPEGFTVLTLRGERIDWEYVTYGWKARRPRNA